MGQFDTLDNQQTMPGGPEGSLLGGRYRVVRKLGEGGMGMVYLAEDAELDNTKVAIKFIPPTLAGNPRAVKGLVREAQIARKLSHPNIVRLHDLHTDGHQKFLVMEYIEGKTLEELLAAREDEKLTMEELLPIAGQIAAGLDYAHSLDPPVLHRDLKPSNIMIDNHGVAKILDFGIAREMKDSVTRVTGQETSGTLPYMSPQQLRGEPPSVAMDIYSLAAIFYECLCGHPPFFTGDIGHQILHEQVRPLSSQGGAINAGLLSALSKDPAHRPKDCAELLARMKTGAKPAPQKIVLVEPARSRRKLPILAAITIPLAIVSIAVVFALGYVAKLRQQPAPYFPQGGKDPVPYFPEGGKDPATMDEIPTYEFPPTPIFAEDIKGYESKEIPQTYELFREDFSDNIRQWATGSFFGYRCDLYQGQYIIANDLDDRGANTWTWSAPSVDPSAGFEIEADVRHVAGATNTPSGIFWGARPRPEGDLVGFFFAILADGQYAYVKWIDGAWIFLRGWTSSSQIYTGDSSNRLTVRVQGYWLTLLINGQIVDSTAAEASMGELIGFHVGGRQAVAFDNLVVRSIE
ncbi:MAG: hypothetical protein A2Y77_12385 [Planctomycetes bacterium RBG_13_62_9]|nr:MAG: hypothetical protein A2Y77_12385 [Planctomycetes bacterium RBG_13_62_9]